MNLIINQLKYNCTLCDFICSKKSDWLRHIVRPKHINNENSKTLETMENAKTPNKYFECECGKIYKQNSGLWKHKQKCKYNHHSHYNHHNQEITNENKVIQSPINLDIEQLTLLLINTVKQSQELQKQTQEFQKQSQEYQQYNQEFQKQMFVMMKDNMGSNNNNINNINSNNKFNLNVFLNETCKDAMNLSDFIESIKVKFEDIEYSGENGFAAGVSRIFVQELNKLEICKRPIHCSDIKREIFHIKDQDSWEKERKLLVKVIQQITRKNIVLLVDWRLAHPGCMEYKNIMNNKYDKINGECLGPYKDDEELRDYNRIISNVAKATMIDKKPIL